MSKIIRSPEPESPGRIAWRRLRKNRLALSGAVILVVLYTLALFAGFFSPYSPTDQEFRDLFFHPPTGLHFHDSAGNFHLRPSIVPTHMANQNEVRYASGSPASICYRRAGANRNPYLRDSLEADSAVITIRDDRGAVLLALSGLRETEDDSGIFCAALALDAEKLQRCTGIRADSAFGESQSFTLTPGKATEDPSAASHTLFLRNDRNQPVSSYSSRVDTVPVQFFVRGWRYRILWIFQSDLHLFGTTEPAHIFLLGTDQSGRDQFSRILFGAQISLSAGLFAVALTTIFGLLIGGIAGYFGGTLDAATMRFVEIILSIPGLYLILTLRNLIPDHLQESYDRIHALGMETFAWQQSASTFIAILSTTVLLLSYYCYRGKWRAGRVAASGLVLLVTAFGPWLIDGALALIGRVLPGSTHLTSQWTYLMIIVILSVVGWAGMARVIRGMVLSLRESDYVLAARALGARDARVLLRHILPNTFGYVIVRATLLIPIYILGEVALSFLALGVQEPVPSWGNMLTQAQSVRVLTQFTWTLAPGFFIFLTVLAYNILGDGLRDAFDPRQ